MGYEVRHTYNGSKSPHPHPPCSEIQREDSTHKDDKTLSLPFVWEKHRMMVFCLLDLCSSNFSHPNPRRQCLWMQDLAQLKW